MLNRVRSLRRHLSSEMGFLIPPVHISDNLRLKPREYLFSLRGMEIGRWQTEGPQLLAVSGDPNRRPLAGKEAREPAFGVPAIWIAPALEDQAIAAGYSVVDAVTVITTHLGELIRRHACELLGRAEIKRLLDALNDSHPKLIEELVPKLLTLGEVGRVLEQLLRERVSIRDLGAILEALLEAAPVNKSLVALVEAARQALGRRLVRPLLDADGQLAGAAARPRPRRRDSRHALARRRPAPAARRRPLPATPRRPPPHRFCEATYRFRLRCGPSRAPLSESGPLSRQAVAGTGACRVWRWLPPVRFRPRSGCARWARCAEPRGRALVKSVEQAEVRVLGLGLRAEVKGTTMGTGSGGELRVRTLGREGAAEDGYPPSPAGRLATLTAEQEQVLLEHLPIVRFLARRIHERLPQHVDIEDLVSAGVVGLMDAFAKFDPDEEGPVPQLRAVPHPRRDSRQPAHPRLEPARAAPQGPRRRRSHPRADGAHGPRAGRSRRLPPR